MVALSVAENWVCASKARGAEPGGARVQVVPELRKEERLHGLCELRIKPVGS